MGGAYVALRPDSTMPIFLNVGNPASYSLIRLTTLEVGGTYLYSHFTGKNNTALTKWGTNFSYGALGFPIRRNGGACFGIMPFSYVGYQTNNNVVDPNVGLIQYQFNGDGGLNKAFVGYGITPFKKQLVHFRTKHLYLHDTLKTLSHKQYLRREKLSKLISDFSLGFNANYIFGNITNSTRVVYPNSILYNNTYRERILTMGDFTGSFGAQTAVSIDSIADHKGRRKHIEAVLRALKTTENLSEAQLKQKRDSVSDATPLHNRALREKIKFTFGYFTNLTNPLKVSYNAAVYNYILNGAGQEILRDTALYLPNQKNTIRLPLEQGFGVGMKKGEKLNVVADFAITKWSRFKYLNDVNTFKDNYRVAIGANYVPEKYAAGRGAFARKVNYRIGASYQSGYINVKNSLVSDYSISVGIGLPVGIGRLSSMVNVSAQYGVMGTNDPTLIKQNYWRINFGFTYCDRWFQKFRYD